MVNELPIREPSRTVHHPRATTRPLLLSRHGETSHPDGPAGESSIGTRGLILMSDDHCNVKGYTTPRGFSGFQVPISLQSAAIRRYCEEQGLTFNHHVSENITPGTYLVLERIVAEAHLFQALAMCSIGMLPNNEIQRSNLLARCVTAGLTVHFLFEQVVVKTHKDINSLDELLSLTGLLRNDSGRMSLIQNLIHTT